MAVAFDVENFTVSYDLADGVNNPADIRFEGADLAAGGTLRATRSPNNIRKVNVVLAGRSRRALSNTGTFFRNSLSVAGQPAQPGVRRSLPVRTEEASYTCTSVL